MIPTDKQMIKRGTKVCKNVDAMRTAPQMISDTAARLILFTKRSVMYPVVGRDIIPIPPMTDKRIGILSLLIPSCLPFIG